MSQDFARVARLRGFDISLHDLRHTHITLLLEAGHQVKAVSARVGHADVTVTLRTYAHVLKKSEMRLAEASGDLVSGALGE